MSLFRIILVIFGLAIHSTSAHAAIKTPFTQADFLAAQAKDEPILIDVHAWWCPICFMQRRAVTDIIAAPSFDKLHIFEIDYDHQNAEWKSFGAKRQGTLIGFKGKTEVGRIDFQTDPAKIRALLESVVQ